MMMLRRMLRVVALGLIDATEKDSRFLLVLLRLCVSPLLYVTFSSPQHFDF